MKNKIFRQILELIDEDISNIYDCVSIHIFLFDEKAKEIKARSHGGYEVVKLVGEFNELLNQKSTELLEKTSNIFKQSGRKLSAKQYDLLIEKFTKPFVSSIDNFKAAFQKEFERNATIETSLKLFQGNMEIKIRKHIKAFKIFTSTKLDKALWWTAIGTVFAGLSLILSVIAIMIAK